jgi:hypothetical protein
MTKTFLHSILVLILFPALAFGQTTSTIKVKGKNKTKPFAPVQGSFLLSTLTSFSSFGGSAPALSTGLGAEYYIVGNWSLRGGIQMRPDYLKFTPAPFTAELFHFISNDDTRHGHAHLHNSRGAGKGLFYLFASLAMNDGLCYNMPLSHNLRLSPYIGTWQFEMRNEGTVLGWQEFNNCAMGMSLKYQPMRHWIVDVGAEYNRTVFFTDARQGYRLNFSVGYKFS